ncbi:MAG: DUF1648 domain-containing protein [Alphaproteobacteria bacterium]|nr:DUF1648 domain-containing protein [Alphaproteobacteria bacterium]
MNVKPLVIVNSVLVLGMIGLSAWAWQVVPTGAQIPVHWNLHGQVDRFGSKTEGLLILPAMGVFFTFVMWFLPRVDPRRANLERSAKMWNALSIAVVALLAYVHVLIVLKAIGRPLDMVDYLIPGLSVLFIVIGNYLPKTRSNWFAGVRTPWTLSSEYSWNRTHRLAGLMFVASGALTLGTWFVLGGKIAVVALIVTILATSVTSVVASYFYWRGDPARTALHANGGG